ncbi:hypothetical protein EDC17_100322 [Sphingobacterium alimentarium]|uniref:Uncharacterized protein n=1 Tax=Sphingobacterium alimentarium TaxID=797292 RepID=A0A4R3W0W9_9SPHI|nr:hypothetical protein [Sphingobacterium alimentarium]TCV19923.1 hypothetical protein EDC17_100322 [Sphingobacterium alimentarium]
MKCTKIFSIVCMLLLSTICLPQAGWAQSPQKLGKVKSALITEISGITPYGYGEGYFWVHNDSGDGPFVYLIDSTANLKVKVEVEGVKFTDVEDIARFQVDDKKYLVLADIGNNLRNREILSLYVIEEPQVTISKSLNTIRVPLLKEIKVRYSDKRRDAEAIFVDPTDHQLYITSKRDFESTVFSLPLDLNGSTAHTLRPLLTLPFTFTTSADISGDRKYIVAKNLTTIYMWERQNGQSVIETMSQTPQIIPYIIEPQGEAICFDLYNRFLYTISERPFGLDSYLYKYEF